MFSGVAVSLLIAFFIWCIVKFVEDYFKMRHIPGPNAFIPSDVLSALRNPVKYFKQMTKHYGKVFVYYPGWIFSSPLLFVSDIKAMRSILTDTKTFTKGEDYTVRFATALGNGLVTSVGDTHRKQRSLVAKYFGKSKIDSHIPDMERVLFRTMETQGLATIAKDGKLDTMKGNDLFDMQKFCQLLTMRTIADIIMQHNSSLDQAYEKECIRDICMGTKVLGDRVFFKMPISMFDPQIRYVKERTKALHSQINDVVASKYSRYGSDLTKWPDTALRALLMAEDISQNEMNEQLTTILMAGFETTATFLSYAAYRIAKYTKVQDKIREEIKKVMGDRTEMTSEDVKNFRFLTCVLKESMRWLVIIPAVTRITTKESVLKKEDDTSLVIPQGTNIIIPFYLPNFDEDVWDEPNKFIPERMEKMPDLASARHGYMPFGYGTRSCIGNHLAFTEAICALVHLLQNFKFELVRGFRPIPTFGMSTTSANGMHIKLVSLSKA